MNILQPILRAYGEEALFGNLLSSVKLTAPQRPLSGLSEKGRASENIFAPLNRVQHYQYENDRVFSLTSLVERKESLTNGQRLFQFQALSTIDRHRSLVEYFQSNTQSPFSGVVEDLREFRSHRQQSVSQAASQPVALPFSPRTFSEWIRASKPARRKAPDAERAIYEEQRSSRKEKLKREPLLSQFMKNTLRFLDDILSR